MDLLVMGNIVIGKLNGMNHWQQGSSWVVMAALTKCPLIQKIREGVTVWD